MKQPAIKVRAAGKRPAEWTQRTRALIDNFPACVPCVPSVDYDTAAAILDALAVRPEGSLKSGEQDYFDTLTLLVELYDREHFTADTERDPLSMLKYMMQESGMAQADLGRLLGNYRALWRP